ncbi:hypothetical protein M422DRAFT_228738 [Sphaerobolus stellatus SS14]|uniref:Uncharacterized protein n=1 Tax=Sphaerobolus stellatus (strain SS14) TaxID=990650 RepID=A0A0C9VAU4_SPHS4|nr:hypothetical protein M422DRAFT_228738 [Sphaerobolus stellatus SS14]
MFNIRFPCIAFHYFTVCNLARYLFHALIYVKNWHFHDIEAPIPCSDICEELAFSRYTIRNFARLY